MKKPAKAEKKLKRAEKERPPADQMQLPTVCEMCMKQFADPTTARIHMDEMHEGQYADA